MQFLHFDWLSRYGIFNNYSPKAKLILLNNPRADVEGIFNNIN